MRSIPTVNILLVFLAIACTGSSQQTEPEKVQVVNAGFENGMANWAGNGSIVHNEKHSGANSLLLQNGICYQPPDREQLIRITPGHDYRISVWVKATDMGKSLATVTAVCRGGKEQAETALLGKWLPGDRPEYVYGGKEWPALICVGDTPNWKRFEAGIPADQLHPQTRALSLVFRHDIAGRGNAYFDDLTVEKLPKGTIKLRSISELGSVRNSGFESGKQYWEGPGTSITDKDATQGKSCLQISEGYALQKAIPIEEGKRIRLSLKVKCENAEPDSVWAQASYRGSGIKAGWNGIVQKKIGRRNEPVVFTTGGTHPWKQVSVVLQPPDDAKQLFLYLRKDGVGTAFFDDVEVKAANAPATTPAELRRQQLAPSQPMLEDADFARKELSNPDFSRKLQDWLTHGAVTTEPVTHSGGKACLKIVHGSAMQGLQVTKGERYKIKVKTRCEAAAESSTRVMLYFRDRKGKIVKSKQVVATGGNHDWKAFSAIAQVPENVNCMVVSLEKDRDDGSACFMGLQIDRTTDPVTEDRSDYRVRVKRLMRVPSNPESIEATLKKVTALAAENGPSSLVLTDKGKTSYRIYAGSQDIINTRSIRLPNGRTLKSLTFQLLHAQHIDSGFPAIPLSIQLPAKPVKSLKCQLSARSRDPSQSYSLGIRLQNANGRSSEWQSGRYRHGGRGWTVVEEDFTSRVNSLVKHGYTRVSEMFVRAYSPKGACPFIVDNVSIQMNGRQVYVNDFEGNEAGFSPGGRITPTFEDAALPLPLFRLTDGTNPPKIGILEKIVPMKVTTGWEKASGEVIIGVASGWYVGITEITYGGGGKADVSYQFQDLEEPGPLNGIHRGIDFGGGEWKFAESPGIKKLLEAKFLKLKSTDLDPENLEPVSADLDESELMDSTVSRESKQLREYQNAGKFACFQERANPLAMEFYAAEELANYLHKMTGAYFTPFAHDGNPASGPLLIVGRNNVLTDHLAPGIPYDKLGEDGFVIRSAGPHIIITGATPRGTLYGVYWFLDHCLGIRWFSPSYTYIPTAGNLQIKKLTETQIPRFSYRELFSKDGDDESYRAHNLLNGKSHHRKSHRSKPELNSWSTDWTDDGHNFYKAVPAKDLHVGGQLAAMDKRTRSIAASYFVKRIGQKKSDDLAWLGFSQEDRSWEPDTDSLQFAKAHGGALSAPVIDMLMDVARQVRSVYPTAKFGTFAYQWSLSAPTGIKIPDYVQVTVCPINADYSQPYNAPGNRTIAKDIENWAKAAQHLVIWDYSATNFSAYMQPHPTFDSMFDSIHWLAGLPSVKGYFGQGSMGSIGAEFAHLRQWVGARLLWNPDQDWHKLVREFVTGYYGDASPFMMEYIELMHNAKRGTRAKMPFKTSVMAPFLSFETMRKADELFDKAEKAVAGKPGFERRVQTARIGVDAVILLRRGDYRAEAQKLGIDWNSDTENRLKRLQTYADAAGITRYGEGTGSMSGMIRNMEIERTKTTPLTVTEGRPRDEWVEVQDLGLKLAVCATVVPDKLASDGGAAMMPGNRADWGIQLNLDFLPPQGHWKLYACVRVDPGQGPEEANAMTFGVYPGQRSSVSVKEVADGRYHVFAVPGVYKSNAGQYLWFAPPKSKAVNAMYVDRIVAVQVAGDL